MRGASRQVGPQAAISAMVRFPVYLSDMPVHRLATSTKVLLMIAILWLSGVSVALHPALNKAVQLHGVQHAAARGELDHVRMAAFAREAKEDQQGLPSLFHNADTCSLASLAPQVSHAETVQAVHAYVHLTEVLSLVQRFTHPLRPPIARV